MKTRFPQKSGRNKMDNFSPSELSKLLTSVQLTSQRSFEEDEK